LVGSALVYKLNHLSWVGTAKQAKGPGQMPFRRRKLAIAVNASPHFARTHFGDCSGGVFPKPTGGGPPALYLISVRVVWACLLLSITRTLGPIRSPSLLDVPSERPGPNNNVPAGVRGASLGPGARGCEWVAAVWLGTKYSSQTAVMDLLALSPFVRRARPRNWGSL
jgi:hypothetical protein